MVYTSELICIFQLHSRRDGKRENFAEKGVASRQVVRERWSRVLKVRLLEGEQEAASTWRHRKSLLEHVASLGVTDRREIRWAEVANHFRPVTAAALVRVDYSAHCNPFNILIAESRLLESNTTQYLR